MADCLTAYLSIGEVDQKGGTCSCLGSICAICDDGAVPTPDTARPAFSLSSPAVEGNVKAYPCEPGPATFFFPPSASLRAVLFVEPVGMLPNEPNTAILFIAVIEAFRRTEPQKFVGIEVNAASAPTLSLLQQIRQFWFLDERMMYGGLMAGFTHAYALQEQEPGWSLLRAGAFRTLVQ